MAGFVLKNTLSDNGGVTRGICKMDTENNLTEVVETGNIIKTENGAEADGVIIATDSHVSMNMWGFTRSILDELKAEFPQFLKKGLTENPMKCEYFLPFVVNAQLADKSASVQVLPCEEAWYGVTYREDKPLVVEAIARKTAEGQYPENLWA